MQNVQYMLIMFPKCFPNVSQIRRKVADTQHRLAAAQAAVEE